MTDEKAAVKRPKRVRKPVAKKSVKTVSSVSPQTQSLDGVQKLFQQSWELFKGTYVSYVTLVLLGIGLFLAICLIGFVLGLPLMISSGGSASNLLSNPSALQTTGIILVILWAITSIVVLCVFGIFASIANVLIVSSAQKLAISEMFKRSKPLLLPYFLTTLLLSIVVLGGWTLLIIPGVIFSILFSFVTFSIVLEGKTRHAALRSSYQIVKSHFWEVFVRILLIQIVIFVGTFVLDSLAEEAEFFSLVSFIFSVASGWFTQVYMYLVYKQLRSMTSPNTPVSMRWVWVVSGIGLALFVILMYVFIASGLWLLQSPEFVHFMNTGDPSSLDSL